MMLELTQNAANALKRAIGRDQGEAKGVRIALAPSGCAELRFKLDLASAAPGGRKYLRNGRRRHIRQSERHRSD